MYGYVVPYKQTLGASDFVLYRAFYCGVCCQTGKLYGQLPRFTTNYDVTFLAALLHDGTACDIVIEEHKCVLNPVKKKAVLQPNPLLERIAAANILLAYHKAEDGVIDGDGVKYRVAKRMLYKPFKRALSVLGDANERIALSYKQLRELEKSGESSTDRAAAPDHLEDDRRHKRYNPFIAAYGDGFKTRKDFIANNRDKLEFCFNAVTGRAIESFEALHFCQSYSLIKNIVCEGMPKKAEELLMSEKKLPPPRL